jgi:hypothetical protein
MGAKFADGGVNQLTKGARDDAESRRRTLGGDGSRGPLRKARDWPTKPAYRARAVSAEGL